MMKHIFTLLLLFSIINVQAQQITGEVKDADSGEILVGASIRLLEGNEVAITDINGAFSLEGKGSIRVTYIGYEPFQVNPGDDFITVRLRPMQTELQGVEITGRLAEEYNSDYTFSATKIATANKDIPQSISTVTKELMADRQAFRLGDVLKNVSGVSTVSFYNHYAIRGVTQNSASIENRLINGMRTSQIYFNQPLSSNVERVEVIKGPSSMTFSNTDAGGSINIVTKKPLAVARQQVSLTAGSFNTMRAAMDFTGPLNDDKTLLYRLNVGYENARSFRDLQFKKAVLVAPSFSYVPNDKTRINLELTLNQDNSRLDRGQPIFGATAGITDLSSTPISFAIGAANDAYRTQDASILMNLTHAFSQQVSFNLSYMKHGWNEELSEHRTSNVFARDSLGNSIPTLVEMLALQRQNRWYTNNINAFFNVKTGNEKIRNNAVIGFDHIHFHQVSGSGQTTGRGYLNAAGTGVINSYDPENPELYRFDTFAGLRAPVPNVPYFNLENPEYLIKNSSDYFLLGSDFDPAVYFTNGIYILNETRFDNFILNLGLRQEFYTDLLNFNQVNQEKLTQTALLPRAGITYTVSKNINVYGVYTESYQPQSAASLANPNTGGPFDPMLSNMVEFGTKTTWYGGTFQGNLSLFEINQRNILINANDPVNVDLLRQRGAERYRGIEMDLTGYVFPNLLVNLAYAYLDAKIVADNEPLQGLRKENTPRNNISFWGRYDFLFRSMEGIGLGLGANHVGEKIPWYTREFMIPAYTVMDAAVYYKVDNMQISLNVNNLFDQKYWLGAINYTRLYPAAPRNLMLNVTLDF